MKNADIDLGKFRAMTQFKDSVGAHQLFLICDHSVCGPFSTVVSLALLKWPRYNSVSSV